MRPSLGEQDAQWHWQTERSWRQHVEHEGLKRERNEFACDPEFMETAKHLHKDPNIELNIKSSV